MAAPLLDGTGRWRDGFAPFTFSSIGIHNMELGPRFELVLGVLFAASSLKMTRSKFRFAPRLSSETHPTGHDSPPRRPFACGSVSLALARYRAASWRLDLPSAAVLAVLESDSVFSGTCAMCSKNAQNCCCRRPYSTVLGGGVMNSLPLPSVASASMI